MAQYANPRTEYDEHRREAQHKAEAEPECTQARSKFGPLFGCRIALASDERDVSWDLRQHTRGKKGDATSQKSGEDAITAISPDTLLPA